MKTVSLQAESKLTLRDYSLSNVQISSFSLEFLLGHSITAGICEVNFHFFDTIANICFEPLILAFRETRHAK